MKTKEVAKRYNINQEDFEIFIEKRKIPHTLLLGCVMQISDERVEEFVARYKTWKEEQKKRKEIQIENQKSLALEQKAEMERKELALANILLTTGYQFEGYKIVKYMEIVSADTVLGTGAFSEFGAGLSDLLGVESGLFSEKVQQARQSTQKKLIVDAVEKGANAIIGVDFDYIVFGQNMIGVSVTGTAVIVEKTEEAQM